VISAREAGGSRVIAVAGESDLGDSPALEAAIDDALANGVPVAIDLSDSTFVDSSVLRVLTDGARLAEERATPYAIVTGEAGASQTLELFRMVGLAARLPTYPTLDEALSDIA
jgi:anti-anti-sigma factor